MKWWIIRLTAMALACAAPACAAASRAAGPETAPSPVRADGPRRSSAPGPEGPDSLFAPGDAEAMTVDSLKEVPPAYRAYLRRMERRRRRWNKLIPNQATLQFAGSIGMFSAGPGWHYGKKGSWETELLVGIVPRYNSESAKATFTAKQRYIPWHLPVGRRWVAEPLTVGVFFSSIFGEDFWANEPSRYPKKYYGFSTKIRANVFLGQRVKYRIPRAKRRYHKSVSLYYELSTCDLYVVSAIPNKRVTLGDILSLAVGARFEVF